MTKSSQAKKQTKTRRGGARRLAVTLLTVQCAGLLVAIVANMFAVPALAQGQAGTIGQAQPASSPGQQGRTIKQIRDDFFDRNPWAKKKHDQDRTETVPGTNQMQKAVDEIPAFPMPVSYNTATPLDQSGQRWMMQMQSGVATTPIQQRDIGNIVDNYTNMNLFITDTSFAIHSNQAIDRALQVDADPETKNWNTGTAASMATAGASNSAANVAEQSLMIAFDRIIDADGATALINVANEASGTGGNVGALFRTIPDAVGMVMRMYKQVYVPMAILFLLPGAVISQVKSTVGRGLANTVNVQEAQHPFDGLLRSIVAVFLIPATQVIVSWSIDVGNSMAFSMVDWIDIPMIIDWFHELSYNPPASNNDNTIRPPQPGGGQQGGQQGGGGGGTFAALGASMLGSFGGFLGGLLDSLLGAWGGAGEGIAVNQHEADVHLERQGFLGIILQMTFNILLYTAGLFIVFMSAYQVVLICYLFLLGPLAAAFYAWPHVNQGNGVAVFRGVFGNWVEAVIKVSLWRFYWMVILAVITQRLIYTGGGTGDLQWEVCMFASFLGIMMYVPGQPFDFLPTGAFGVAAQNYTTAMQTAQGAAKGQGGGGGGKGGGAAGGGKHSEGEGGTQTNETKTPGGDQQSPQGQQPQPEQPAQQQSRGIEPSQNQGQPQNTENKTEQNVQVQSPPSADKKENAGSGNDTASGNQSSGAPPTQGGPGSQSASPGGNASAPPSAAPGGNQGKGPGAGGQDSNKPVSGNVTGNASGEGKPKGAPVPLAPGGGNGPAGSGSSQAPAGAPPTSGPQSGQNAGGQQSPASPVVNVQAGGGGAAPPPSGGDVSGGTASKSVETTSNTQADNAKKEDGKGGK